MDDGTGTGRGGARWEVGRKAGAEWLKKLVAGWALWSRREVGLSHAADIHPSRCEKRETRERRGWAGGGCPSHLRADLSWRLRAAARARPARPIFTRKARGGGRRRCQRVSPVCRILAGPRQWAPDQAFPGLQGSIHNSENRTRTVYWLSNLRTAIDGSCLRLAPTRPACGRPRLARIGLAPPALCGFSGKLRGARGPGSPSRATPPLETQPTHAAHHPKHAACRSRAGPAS